MFGRKELEKRIEELEKSLQTQVRFNGEVHRVLSNLIKRDSKYKMGDMVEFISWGRDEPLEGVISNISLDNCLRLMYRITTTEGYDYDLSEHHIIKVIKNVCKK